MTHHIRQGVMVSRHQLVGPGKVTWKQALDRAVFLHGQKFPDMQANVCYHNPADTEMVKLLKTTLKMVAGDNERRDSLYVCHEENK